MSMFRGEPRQQDRQDMHALFLAWIAFFAFATCAAAMFQKLVLPAIPSMHAGLGLMSNDATYFHNAAKGVAQHIAKEGWHVWSFWPTPYDTGNVAVLGALYALFRPDPLLVLPINAAMHALTGVLVISCGWRLTGSRAGRVASVLAGTLYVVLPTPLIWYGQLHKDSYADLAYLWMFSAILVLLQSVNWRQRLQGVVQIVLATAMVVFVRPQYLIMLMLLLAVGMLPTVLGVIRRRFWLHQKAPVNLLYALLILSVSSAAIGVLNKVTLDYIASAGKGINIENYMSASGNVEPVPMEDETASSRWEGVTLFPDVINRELEKMGRIRLHMQSFDIKSGAHSGYDVDVKPDTAAGVIAFAPKAFAVALLAPFPNDWLRPQSAMQLVGIAESILYYLLIPGFVWFLMRRLSPEALGILLGAMCVMAILGIINSNLGNLHRIRYPFHFIPALFGVIGWFEMIASRRKTAPRSVEIRPHAVVDRAAPDLTLPVPGKRNVITTIIWIVLISLPGYIGFFLRDMIMARQFGLTTELDAFQAGMALPTFFATLLLVPLTNAVVPEFTRLNIVDRLSAENWIRRLIGMSLLASGGAALLCALLWWGLHQSGLRPSGADSVFVAAIVILLLSSWITIGSGLLNAVGAQRTAAIGQSLVPWPPIVLLLLYGDRGGALVVTLGMIVGQLINLAFVVRGARKAGFHLWPSAPQRSIIPRSVGMIYLSTVANSFLFGAAVPIGIFLALKLGTGQAGAFALGSKLVVLTYAVASAVTTAVVMPYFAKHVVAGQVDRAHRDLVKFMHLALLVSVFFAVAVFGFAHRLVPFLFGGGKFSVENGNTVAAVVQFGSLQIPFMLTNLLIVRFSEASSKALRAIGITLLAQAVTITFAVVFSKHYGAEGIALAGTLGIIVATLVFVLFLIKDRVLSWLDAGISLLGWWLFLTICLCFYFDSVIGACTAGLAFLILVLYALLEVKEPNADEAINQDIVADAVSQG